MRFTFLGTGTSAGIPVIACACPTCTSDDPRDTRLRTGACLRWTDHSGHERVVLIDTTPDLRQQALRHNLTRCDAILFTHNHVDHVFGLDEIRRFNAVMQAPIDIYAEPHTLDALRRVYQHVFDARHNVNKSFVADLIAHPIAPHQPIDLWGVRFTPLRLLHGRLPIVGFRIEETGNGQSAIGNREEGNRQSAIGNGPEPSEEARTAPHSPSSPLLPDAYSLLPSSVLPLAYCTDVSAIPPETWPHLRNLRTLVLDCLRFRHHPTHLTVDQAVSTAEQIGATQTWFVHMAHQVKHAETQATLPEGMSLAWDNLELGA